MRGEQSDVTRAARRFRIRNAATDQRLLSETSNSKTLLEASRALADSVAFPIVRVANKTRSIMHAYANFVKSMHLLGSQATQIAELPTY